MWTLLIGSSPSARGGRAEDCITEPESGRPGRIGAGKSPHVVTFRGGAPQTAQGHRSRLSPRSAALFDGVVDGVPPMESGRLPTRLVAFEVVPPAHPHDTMSDVREVIIIGSG